MTYRFRVAFAAAALVALAVPALAMGHADLVSSDPADGSTLSTTPYTLTATFAEEIDTEASTLFVENSSGVEVAHGTVNADDNTMMTAELPALPDGVYTVRWTTVTPDDNGIERDTFTFTVAPAATTPAPTPVAITPGSTGSGDILIALVLAAIGIAVVVAFVFLRGRR
jgi:methionine-rich copper-binding protein CopC